MPMRSSTISTRFVVTRLSPLWLDGPRTDGETETESYGEL